MSYMFIDPRGPHGLRKVLSRMQALEANIRRSDKGLTVSFDDGRYWSFTRESGMSSSRFVAAAVQWARRHGATAIAIDADLD